MPDGALFHYAVLDRAAPVTHPTGYTIRFAAAINVFGLSYTYTNPEREEDWITYSDDVESLIERCRGEPVTILPAKRLAWPHYAGRGW